MRNALGFVDKTCDADLCVMANFIDAAYGVHGNCKSQRSISSMGYGVIYAMSIKQKLSTKSSTEEELVWEAYYCIRNRA